MLMITFGLLVGLSFLDSNLGEIGDISLTWSTSFEDSFFYYSLPV
jgi:hypothetical protein